MHVKNLALLALGLVFAFSAAPAMAHSTATAIYCDDDFGSDGAFSGFVNSGGHLNYSGGANNNADHEEGIGVRINVGGGPGAFKISDTTTGEADPNVFYVYQEQGETFVSNAGIVITTSSNGNSTTNTYSFAGLSASRNNHNHGGIHGGTNAHGNGVQFIYVNDFGSVAAGNFTDFVPPPIIDGSNPTAVSRTAEQDCLDYVNGQVVYE